MKKHERDFIMYLEDILACTKRIGVWTKNMTQEEFVTDRKTQDAIIMNIGIIGEATKNLPPFLSCSNRAVCAVVHPLGQTPFKRLPSVTCAETS